MTKFTTRQEHKEYMEGLCIGCKGLFAPNKNHERCGHMIVQQQQAKQMARKLVLLVCRRDPSCTKSTCNQLVLVFDLIHKKVNTLAHTTYIMLNKIHIYKGNNLLILSLLN